MGPSDCDCFVRGVALSLWPLQVVQTARIMEEIDEATAHDRKEQMFHTTVREQTVRGHLRELCSHCCDVILINDTQLIAICQSHNKKRSLVPGSNTELTSISYPDIHSALHTALLWLIRLDSEISA